MVPAKRNEFAYSEAYVGEQRDQRLIAPLEITRKGVGQTGIANLLDLFGDEPGCGLLLNQRLNA